MSSSKIKPKRSFVSGVSPNQSQLEQGEIAFNYTDKKLFTKNENNEIVEIGLGGGSTSTIVLKSKLIDNRYVNSYSKWSNLPVIGDFLINQGGFINQNNYSCIIPVSGLYEVNLSCYFTGNIESGIVGGAFKINDELQDETTTSSLIDKSMKINESSMQITTIYNLEKLDRLGISFRKLSRSNTRSKRITLIGNESVLTIKKI